MDATPGTASSSVGDGKFLYGVLKKAKIINLRCTHRSILQPCLYRLGTVALMPLTSEALTHLLGVGWSV